MHRCITRAFFASVIAATLAHADLPKHYRLALIQVAYKDRPAAYTIDQLKSAANEISNYYSGISYLNFSLEIVVSSVLYTVPPCVPPCIFPLPAIPFVIDKSGYARPDSGNAVLVQIMAQLA